MPLRECVSCGRDRDLCCRGLCTGCRSQARRDDTLATFGYVKADRLADFAALRRSCSVPVAASRLGVCERTGWRYEAQLQKMLAPVSPDRAAGNRTSLDRSLRRSAA